MHCVRCFIAAATMALGAAGAVSAQDVQLPENDKPHIKVATDARVDFDYDKYQSEEHSSGFHGRYLNLIVDGSLNSHFSAHLRQRLNKFGEMKNDVFGATDWVYIDYAPTERWTLSAGKQVVAIGGFEYDRNPIDIYYASMFWNNIACYQFGVSGAYHSPSNRHTLLAQVCNSPYERIGNSCYAYNLMWMGKMGVFSTIWSTNIMEYARNHYASFISLGNKLTFPGFYAEIDFMNRYSGSQTYFFDDFSLIGKACWTIKKVDIFAKGGYEHYRPELGEVYTVNKPFYGLGAEYFPLRKDRYTLRLHFAADVTHDSQTAERRLQFTAGVMFRFTVLDK